MKARADEPADEGEADQEAARGPQPRNGSNPRKELVREQLIDIAASLFQTKGFDQTSMNDIARALGLGRSAVYHYFRSKEEILASLVESESATPSNELESIRAASGMTATEKLRHAVIGGVTRRLSGQSRFNMLSRLEPQIPEALRPQYNASRRHILDLYVALIEEGIASGEFRPVDPKIAAFAVIGMANWTSNWYSASGAKTPGEIGMLIADFAIHSLAAKNVIGLDAKDVRGIADNLRGQLDALDQLLGPAS